MTDTPVVHWDTDFGGLTPRMELRVALGEWLACSPSFRLAEGAEVTWAGGQVRGQRQLAVVVS
jgi:hypothetical protein